MAVPRGKYIVVPRGRYIAVPRGRYMVVPTPRAICSYGRVSGDHSCMVVLVLLVSGYTTFNPARKVSISLGTDFRMLSISMPAIEWRIKSLRVIQTISRAGLGMAKGRTSFI